MVFLIVVFLLYWFVFNKKIRHQNILLLLASYIFYGWWDYRFLSLIILSTLVDYLVGLQIHGTTKASRKKVLLGISMAFNIGLLAFFKYFNFFVDSWIELLNSVGYQTQNSRSLNIILPVGISFYTFQTMSYTIDVYRNKLVHTKDFISFAAFVSFFPKLVAGPIERASNLLPQILGKRTFSYENGIKWTAAYFVGFGEKGCNCGCFGPQGRRHFSKLP